MTNLVVSSDFNLNNPSDFFGNHPVKDSQTSTGFHVYAPDLGNNIYVTGQNIQYNSSGQPVSGIVTGIVCITGNGQETLFNMSGANFNPNTAPDFATFGQELAYWLGPNPTITTIPGGMSGSETIQAPSGVNDVYGYTGHNTVVYSAPSTQFTIEANSILSPSNGAVTVYLGDPLNPTSANTLHAIQTIQFSDRTVDTQWLTKASLLHTANASEFSVLSELYLAYFNRAPDAIGLDYWAANAYDYIAAGKDTVTTNKLIANNFALTPESLSIYGSVNQSSSTADLQHFVNTVYQNVLNRGPDQAGLDYWVSQLKTGASTAGELVTQVVYAVNSQSGTADQIYLSNKNTVGMHFGVDFGMTSREQGQQVMATYNATYNTSGAAAAVNAANALTSSYMTEASLTANPELIVHLVGVHG